jgi:hypothetical protein
VVELKGPLKVFASSITATDSETLATQKVVFALKDFFRISVNVIKSQK